jgi:hypothetical protein
MNYQINDTIISKEESNKEILAKIKDENIRMETLFDWNKEYKSLVPKK